MNKGKKDIFGVLRAWAGCRAGLTSVEYAGLGLGLALVGVLVVPRLGEVARAPLGQVVAALEEAGQGPRERVRRDPRDAAAVVVESDAIITSSISRRGAELAPPLRRGLPAEEDVAGFAEPAEPR